MTERKKRLRIIQFSLLIFGMFILYFTYSKKSNLPNEDFISKEIQERIKKQVSEIPEDTDIFYNIEYSGLDLAGNRYILKSKEAFSKKTIPEVVQMKSVEAFFYFKDETVLKVQSDYGIYNNKTLNMSFKQDVKAFYEGSELFAQKADYSNVQSYLTISENVRINDNKGTMVADRLLFDIKKQKLDITSFDDKKINTDINLK
tara:strand:- start:3067 stop:3672 length:606 start_codon:yes stop_codon:yes gene_type:complete